MSSRCLHPKISVRPFCLSYRPNFSRAAPHLGDKKSEEPIFTSNSATQTFVKFTVSISRQCRPSTGFLTFLSVLLAATESLLQIYRRRSTALLLFFNFFSPLSATAFPKNKAADNIEFQSQRKRFLKIFSLFFACPIRRTNALIASNLRLTDPFPHFRGTRNCAHASQAPGPESAAHVSPDRHRQRLSSTHFHPVAERKRHAALRLCRPALHRSPLELNLNTPARYTRRQCQH